MNKTLMVQDTQKSFLDVAKSGDQLLSKVANVLRERICWERETNTARPVHYSTYFSVRLLRGNV
jgi:hypothetical protein